MLRPKLRKDQRVVATPMYPNECGDVRGTCTHDIDNVAIEVFGVTLPSGEQTVCMYPPKDFEGECEGVDMFPPRKQKVRDDIESVASELGVVLNELLQLHEHPEHFKNRPARVGGTISEAIVANAKRMIEKVNKEGYRVDLPSDDATETMQGSL